MNNGYYANNIFKFISSDKATVEKHGYNGFKVDILFCKSRTAPAGQVSSMIYDQNKGFDRARTIFAYLNENGKIGGSRKNARYIIGHEDVKFNELQFDEEFNTRPDVRQAAMNVMIPMLQSNMFRKDEHEINNEELGVSTNVIDDILSV